MNGSAEPDMLRASYLYVDYKAGHDPPMENSSNNGATLSRTLGTFWRAQSAGWLFFALFGFVSRILAFEDLRLAVVLTLVLDTVGFLLTALAHGLFRNRIRKRVNIQIILTAMVLSIVAGAIQMLVAEITRSFIDPASSREVVIGTFTVPLVYYTLIFMGWSLAYLWINAEANALMAQIQRSQAQEAALHAELNQLRSQLDSHFLFNALNTVAMEIAEHPRTALEMTNRVAAYLRYSLEHHEQRLCSLAEEVRAVQNYLRIQEIRFENQIECSFDTAPSVRQFLVPHLILQPLFENAVKHGLTSSQHLTINLRAHGDRDLITIEVRNSGKLTQTNHNRRAVGLLNIRRRLEVHYPGKHELSLFQDGNSVVARLSLRGPPCYV